MSKTDPWMLNPEDARKTKNETKFSSKGVICPKRNLTIGEPCKACTEVSTIYQTTVDGDPTRKAAGRKSAKASYFANVVFANNQDKSVIMEMGKKSGDRILEKLDKGEWLDIAHPKKGMGRELKLSKSKSDGFNVYSVDPVLEKVDWDVSDEILENLPNLDQQNLIGIVAEDTEEIFKLSSLKMDESITIRMCPPWKEARERGEKRIITPLFRHWGGVTQENIDNGGLTFDETDPNDSTKTEKAEKASDEEKPWEGKNELPNEKTDTGTTTVDPEPEKEKEKVEEKVETKTEEKKEPVAEREPCFGKATVFEEDDEECTSCKDFKSCARAVLKSN